MGRQGEPWSEASAAANSQDADSRVFCLLCFASLRFVALCCSRREHQSARAAVAIHSDCGPTHTQRLLLHQEQHRAGSASDGQRRHNVHNVTAIALASGKASLAGWSSRLLLLAVAVFLSVCVSR